MLIRLGKTASLAYFRISTGVADVSIDKTLKSGLGLSRARNVLNRGERIAKLIEEDRVSAGRSPLGLPKVRVQKAVAGKKAKKTKEEGDEKDTKKKKK